MPKTKRGRILWKLPSRGKGTCPICASTRIKLLYTQTNSNGKSFPVCKRCTSASQERVDSVIL